MKQIVLVKSGDFDSLEIKTAEPPCPRKGEVAIRVKASGVNFADILARQGLYPDAPKPPCIIGYEVSGIVEDAGEGTDTGFVGKEVLALVRFGGYSDIVTVPLTQVFLKPSQLSFEQAAAIPVNYLTAYELIFVMGGLKQDESVLIHNAGGGVGLAALDIAKKIGAATIGTASKRKHDFLKERGLDYAIDYREDDWEKELKRLTGGKGVELIIDPLGGSHWKKSYRALRATGRLGVFGISEVVGSGLRTKLKLAKTFVRMSSFHAITMMKANKGVFGVDIGNLWQENEKMRIWMKAVLRGVKEGWICPHVDKVFSFEDVGKAHAYIEGRKNIGKVVLVP